MQRSIGHRRSALGAALLAACVVLASSSPALADEGGNGELYFGDLGQAIVAMATFVVLMLVLGKWVWKPLVNQLKRREESISQAIKSAEKQQSEAEALLRQYREQLEQAGEEARRLLADAQAQAAGERERLLDEARDQARQFTEQAKQEIQDARGEAMGQLRNITAEVATDLAGRIIQRDLTREDLDRLFNESLAAIRAQGLKNP
jgi:F-type H+-transporting ATPase subunit b